MPEESLVTLGARVRRARTALGLSQLALARALGASSRTATVSNWERDRTIPARGTVRLIAELFQDDEVVFAWLIHGGPTPPLVSRRPTDAIYVSDPVSPGVAVVTLPPPPGAHDNPELVRRQYAEFAQRVARYAGTATLVPSHELLEWAAMLLRTFDLQYVTAQRLHLVLAALPLPVFELDESDRIVAYHVRASEDGPSLPPDVDLRTRALHEIVPQILPNELADALARCRAGKVMGDVAVTLPFTDKTRAYIARLYLLPDRHIMVFIHRGRAERKDELGVGERVRRKAKG